MFQCTLLLKIRLTSSVYKLAIYYNLHTLLYTFYFHTNIYKSDIKTQFTFALSSVAAAEFLQSCGLI